MTIDRRKFLHLGATGTLAATLPQRFMALFDYA